VDEEGAVLILKLENLNQWFVNTVIFLELRPNPSTPGDLPRSGNDHSGDAAIGFESRVGI
jgi:hypothetical protein